MTPQALQTLIANGEDTRHQFKRDVNGVPCVPVGRRLAPC